MMRWSAFLLLASLAGLGAVLGYGAITGFVREADEGTVAHLWQLLMAAQLPLGAFFAITWLPRSARWALLGLALLALRVVCVGFIGYGLFRVTRYFFGHAPKPNAERMRELPPPDRYYQAAMRELDTHIGPSSSP